MDWSLKTHAKFTSSKRLAWCADAMGARPAGTGLRAFTGADAAAAGAVRAGEAAGVGAATALATGATAAGGGDDWFHGIGSTGTGETLSRVDETRAAWGGEEGATAAAATADTHTHTGAAAGAAAENTSVLSPEERLQRALYTFIYPSDPVPSEVAGAYTRSLLSSKYALSVGQGVRSGVVYGVFRRCQRVLGGVLKSERAQVELRSGRV